MSWKELAATLSAAKNATRSPETGDLELKIAFDRTGRRDRRRPIVIACALVALAMNRGPV